MKRSHLLIHVLLAALASAAGSAVAQGTYPDRPVLFIVPQAAGGANDTIARIVTQKLSQILKQGMVIENKVGAGGNIGTVASARAKPDGYTMLLTTNSAQTINPALYKNTGFDPVKDFEPVATLATAGYLLVTNPSFPAKTLSEVVAHVKKFPPDTISYASAGNGTLNHLVAVMLEKTAGIKMTHIPYKSAAAAATDVVSGQVPLSFQSVPSSIGFVKTGKLNAIAAVNEKRIGNLPDVPTIGETYPGFGATSWYGILAPTGTPKAVIDRMSAAVAEALDSKDVQDSLAAQGCEVLKRTPEEFSKLIQSELPMWAKIVSDSGAKVD